MLKCLGTLELYLGGLYTKQFSILVEGEAPFFLNVQRMYNFLVFGSWAFLEA